MFVVIEVIVIYRKYNNTTLKSSQVYVFKMSLLVEGSPQIHSSFKMSNRNNQPPQFRESRDLVVCSTFEEMNLKPDLLKVRLYSKSYNPRLHLSFTNAFCAFSVIFLLHTSHLYSSLQYITPNRAYTLTVLSVLQLFSSVPLGPLSRVAM